MQKVLLIIDNAQSHIYNHLTLAFLEVHPLPPNTTSKLQPLDAGIISSTFYTTLVVAAVLTSQIAGAWLDFVLRRGCPLLTPTIPDESAAVAGDHPKAA